MAIFPENTRIQIDGKEATALRKAGALIDDPRRQRPRYFDGRFLAARDLIRDQQYFLTREADLGRSTGSGVAEGLWVQSDGVSQTLTIDEGHGITPSGELVRLEQAIKLNIADLPRTEQLSAKFGLGAIPNPPLRSRTGLFALALRPVEYTANPVGSYPTSVTGQRVVEDGDIIEATAVILVPWQDDGDGESLNVRRGRVARSIFTQSEDRPLSANVLPLAMLALQNNVLVWVDVPMLRRELGADRADLPGLGFAPRALRLAHLLQFQSHLQYVQQTVGTNNFPASTWFPALPPAGPLPAHVINRNDFTQSFFPAEMKVDFTIIPEDELPALVEESLALPPVDLTAPANTLEAVALMILAPVPRNEWRAVYAKLSSQSGGLVRSVSPAAANLVAQRKPLEILQRLYLSAPNNPPIDPSNPRDAEWTRLAGLGNLWFVRRRNLAYRDDLVGASVRFAGASSTSTEVLLERVKTLGLNDKLTAVLDKASPRAALEVKSLLSSPRFVDSPALTAAAIGEFDSAPQLNQAEALGVAAKLTAANVGDGLLRLEQSTPAINQPEALQSIAAGNGLIIDKEALSASNADVSAIASRVLANPSGIAQG